MKNKMNLMSRNVRKYAEIFLNTTTQITILAALNTSERTFSGH